MAGVLHYSGFMARHGGRPTTVVRLTRFDETNAFILFQDMLWGEEMTAWLHDDSVPGDVLVAHEEVLRPFGKPEPAPVGNSGSGHLFPPGRVIGHTLVYTFSDSRAAMAFKLKFG